MNELKYITQEIFLRDDIFIIIDIKK